MDGAMALRAAGFSRKPANRTTEAPRAEIAAAPERVPLDLAQLLSPYRKHGRLSVRIERLPHRARLSRGHNNGDRSWSLATDELDGLEYVSEADTREVPTIAIRIVNVDSDSGTGTTLAGLDFRVTQAGLKPAIG